MSSQILHALLIGGGQDLHDVVGMMLESLGHASSSAPDAGRGLASATAQTYDVFLVDVEAPGGLDVVAELRAHPHTADRPILGIANARNLEHAELARQAGAGAILKQPFKRLDLAKVIAQVTP